MGGGEEECAIRRSPPYRLTSPQECTTTTSTTTPTTTTAAPVTVTTTPIPTTTAPSTENTLSWIDENLPWIIVAALLATALLGLFIYMCLVYCWQPCARLCQKEFCRR